MKVADLRKPLPGNDIEVTTVTLEIERLIEKVSGMQDGVLDRATNPRLPGVFSPALHSRLCKLGHAATNAAALMRRLRVLCGDSRGAEQNKFKWDAAGGARAAGEELMKLAMMNGDGSVRFVDGTAEVWTGPVMPGDALGVGINTPQGSAGFIFDDLELLQFIDAALKYFAKAPKG